jgi:superfamily II DNA or RNA helicase
MCHNYTENKMQTIAYVENDKIRIENFSEELKNKLKSLLSYKDKSKEYQIKKMSKNPYAKSSPFYKQLLEEYEGDLCDIDGNCMYVSSGFYSVVKDLVDNIVDNRKDTGEKVALPWSSSSYKLTLRDYQQEAVDIALKNFNGIINLATGLGKSKTAVSLIRSLKRKALVVCPNKSIAKQFENELIEAFGKNKVGFIGSGKYKPSVLTVGIAASVCNRIDDIKKLNLGVIVFDETHHTPANTFYSIAEGLGSVGRIYGLTATAFRSDGKDIFIQAACGDILIQRDVTWGVQNKWLSSPYFIVRKVKTTGKDYKDNKLKAYQDHVLNSDILNNRLLSDSSAFIKNNKYVLILVSQVEHGKFISEKLGINFANGTDKNSSMYIDQFNEGKIKFLVATDGMVGEGVDTRNVEVLIMANFTASKSAVLQAVGRGLRKTAQKDKCIILDYIPEGSSMLTRHAKQRIKFYKEITKNVKLL